jgi:hypothetical protein
MQATIINSKPNVIDLFNDNNLLDATIAAVSV